MTAPIKPLSLDDVKFASRMSQARTREVLDLAEKLTQDPKREQRLARQECAPCFYSTRLAGQAFTAYHCVLCQTKHQYHNTATPKLCPACATHNNLCVRCCADITGINAANTRTAPPIPAGAQ